nr:MaoC family dehydratase N-terminal domain-containing protein [Paraburkholderia fungorum]
MEEQYVDLSHLQQWRGRESTVSEPIDARLAVALGATLDRADPVPAPGDPLPPLWHWAYFNPMQRQSELDTDGHPARGGFLPPVPLPRRMWAGGRLRFVQPLRVGAEVSRTSRIADVREKSGRSGHLVFVEVTHELRDASGLLMIEEQDIVYRDAPAADAPKPSPTAARRDESWRRAVHPDETMLFRYSAVTFNGHRIHYDHQYVTREEGYPGLVVHGPLIATLLADLLRGEMTSATLHEFEFRAQRPTFVGHSFEVCGKPADDGETIHLWARDHEGWLTMQATARVSHQRPVNTR